MCLILYSFSTNLCANYIVHADDKILGGSRIKKKSKESSSSQSSESSLKLTVDMLRKQLKDSQMLLEMHKKMSLAKSIELEDSKKQIIRLKKKLELSLPDEEDIDMKTDYHKTQKMEMVEQEELKFVDYDIPKSVISDKALILQEG